MIGVEQQTLTINNLPSHNHQATATSTLVAEGAPASSQNPQGRMLAGAEIYADPAPEENRNMAPGSVDTTVQIENTGGSQPVNIVQPALAVNFCIALQGIFPSRN